jgi:hypothetical protein
MRYDDDDHHGHHGEQLHYDENRGGPIHYEEHYGAPVTAIHDDDPYSPIGEGESVGRPSMINIHPPTGGHAGGHGGGGNFFGNGFQDSPRNSTFIRASAYNPLDHAEGAHGGHPGIMHATPTSPGGTRQPVRKTRYLHSFWGASNLNKTADCLRPWWFYRTFPYAQTWRSNGNRPSKSANVCPRRRCHARGWLDFHSLPTHTTHPHFTVHLSGMLTNTDNR